MPSLLSRCGGGAADNQKYENFQGGITTTIASHSVAKLNWGASTGDTLMDVTDPTEPTTIAAGVYEILFLIAWSAAYPVNTEVAVDPVLGNGLANQITGSQSFWKGTVPGVTLTDRDLPKVGGTCYLPAGAQCFVFVFNYDAAPQDFQLTQVEVKKLQ